MIKGVNLGNWLVLEKWMSPDLFDGTDAEDETGLCHQLAPDVLAERYRTHRSTYLTERDFAQLAALGIEAVRIPVPYAVFGDAEPFVGCIEYLDKAFAWAAAHGLKVMIDLHTVPGSQNGFDNGGLCGVCRWHRSPADVEFVLDLLERLTARYRGHSAFWAIEVLNEPISEELWVGLDIPNRYPAADPVAAAESEPVPSDFLRTFYRDAYRRIRAVDADVTIVFHDGFRLAEWGDFFRDAGFENYLLDTHLYLMVHTWLSGEDDLAGYLRYVDTEFTPALTAAAEHSPLIVGEWCLNTSAEAIVTESADTRRAYHRQIADAQLSAWQGTQGWFFWSYKLQVSGPALDGWDFGTSAALGYLPAL
ncbi:MAG: cellulase family glycosylhydrolase [Actinobacteria bacterium]|nr:cellulase family glycosylhydrolase [Actinomycetota bacterium]